MIDMIYNVLHVYPNKEAEVHTWIINRPTFFSYEDAVNFLKEKAKLDILSFTVLCIKVHEEKEMAYVFRILGRYRKDGRSFIKDVVVPKEKDVSIEVSDNIEDILGIK